MSQYDDAERLSEPCCRVCSDEVTEDDPPMEDGLCWACRQWGVDIVRETGRGADHA